MANTYIKYDDIALKNIILRKKRNRPGQAGTKTSYCLQALQEDGSDRFSESRLNFLKKDLCCRGKDLILFPDDVQPRLQPGLQKAETQVTVFRSVDQCPI